jgi:hypothetical protein
VDLGMAGAAENQEIGVVEDVWVAAAAHATRCNMMPIQTAGLAANCTSYGVSSTTHCDYASPYSIDAYVNSLLACAWPVKAS